MELFAWLESTALARIVGESVLVTAWLSGAHLLGFTLVMSAAVVWNLRTAGLLLRAVPPPSMARSSVRMLIAGLIISLVTGLSLFAPRASFVVQGGVFQLKMALALVATVYQLTVSAIVLHRSARPGPWLRASGVVGLALWLSLAIAACWFILFE